MNSKLNFGICWMSRVAAFLATLWVPSVAFGQNCALCYSQAAGAGSRVIQALRSGILILVIPPVLICVGLTVMAYKKRNQFNEE
jgi:ABC-type spermidine/putrescine transport system permease subunit II